MFEVKSVIDFLNQIKENYTFYGDKGVKFETFSPLNNLKNSSITWARTNNNIEMDTFLKFDNVVIIVGEKVNNERVNQFVVSNPHKIFFQLIDYFFIKQEKRVIHPSAVVETKEIGDNVAIGANSYVGNNVKIGNNVVISSNVSIEGSVTIGDNSIIEAGVVIGVIGYGHYKNENNVSVRVAHPGGVKIGKNVMVGANSTVSRGCLGDTIIDDDVKIDNLCHIAHNVHIMSRSMITACTEISGSTTIEEDVWIGPASALNNGIVIGRNSVFGIGTVATKDVPPDKVVVGVPARIIKDNV